MATIDYRLSGEARYPAQLEDVRTAVSWAQDNAAAYGFDADRVFLWGDSAGGHLALMAALTGSKVHGVVAWFPVTGPGRPAVRPRGRGRRTGSRAGLPRGAAPRRPGIVGARAGAAGQPGDPRQCRRTPPILLMHGDVDQLVPAAQSIRLAEALRAAGASVELELVPGATHMWTGASDMAGIVTRSIEFLRARG